MGTPRLLSDAQEVEVALGVLCGFPVEDVVEGYGIRPGTAIQSILGKRSKQWGNPLVELYHATNSRDRIRNGVHAYLGLNHRNIPNAELLEGLPTPVEDRVNALFETAIGKQVADTNLWFFVEPRTPHEHFLATIYGQLNPLHYTRTKLLDRLEEAYGSDSKIKLGQVYGQVQTEILLAIKEGRFTMTAEKIHLIEQAFETASQKEVEGSGHSYLSERERTVLDLRFGLTGETPMGLQEVADHYEVQRERIRQIEAKALGKLRHPRLNRHLKFLAVPRTPQETHDYLADMAHQQEREYWTRELEPGITDRVLAEVVSVPGKLEELQKLRELDVEKRYGEVGKTRLDTMDFSIRTANCFQNASIGTIADLLEKSESELLRTKNFGRKSLREIKEILLDEHDITWPIK